VHGVLLGDLPPFRVDDVNDGAQAVVRVKPLGAGGGGGESSSLSGVSHVRYTAGVKGDSSSGNGTSKGAASLSVGGTKYAYPAHVLGAEHDNASVFDAFMPVRLAGFLAGYNVNVMAYGQTGSGKTHTMFGPPGIMARAGSGKLGDGVHTDYGLFPRSVLALFHAVQRLRSAAETEGTRRSFVLTASAVELLLAGNLDMVVKSKQERAAALGSLTATGVTIDKTQDPPRMFGMVEVQLDSLVDVKRVFRAIASRNTAATGLNDTSSRSHCFVWLTLRVYDGATDKLRTSRMQFVDLAGSERVGVAHHGETNWRTAHTEAINGMVTNFSLTMLGAAVRQLVASKRSKAHVSLRTYIMDLVLLLGDSLKGHALTAVFICISQAPANTSQCKHALNFGRDYSRLPVGRKRRSPWRKVGKLPQELAATARGHKAKLAAGVKGGRYQAMRRAMAVDCQQQSEIVRKLLDMASKVTTVDSSV